MKIQRNMTKLLLLLVIALTCVMVNAQEQASNNKKPVYGQTFDEIVVSSDLNVRRKSKENRQGKRLLSNVPSGTTGTPEKSTAVAASRLLSDNGARVTPIKRTRRETMTSSQGRFLDLGVAGYLLKSRKR